MWNPYYTAIAGNEVSSDNHLEMRIRGNTVENNTGTGNELEGDIAKNTASTVVVEDGVAGNSAEVTQSKNVPCPQHVFSLTRAAGEGKGEIRRREICALRRHEEADFSTDPLEMNAPRA